MFNVDVVFDYLTGVVRLLFCWDFRLSLVDGWGIVVVYDYTFRFLV